MKKINDKGFGKLSPDDMLSASQIPYLFAAPHTVLQQIKDVRAGTYERPLYSEKMEERMNMGNVLESTINELTKELLEIDVNYPVTEVMSKELGIDSNNKAYDLYASLDGIAYIQKATTIVPIEGKIYTPYGEFMENVVGKMVVEYKNMQGKPYDSIDELRLPPYGRGYLQAECQAWIADADYLCVSILFNGNDHRCYVMPASDYIQQEIVAKAHTLYEHLDNGTLYDPVDIETMAAKYNRVNYSEPVQLDGELVGDIDNLNRLKEQIKTTEEEIDRIQMKLIEALAENEIGQINTKQGLIQLERKVRNYKAQPEKFIPAKEARTIRAKTVTIKNLLSYE